MIEFYPEIKLVHVGAVIASGSLFALRGTLMLVTILHQYPFVQGWLTVKVLLLVVYVVLGTLALKRGRTRRMQTTCFFAALAVFLLIASVARAHHPLGIVYTVANAAAQGSAP